MVNWILRLFRLLFLDGGMCSGNVRWLYSVIFMMDLWFDWIIVVGWLCGFGVKGSLEKSFVKEREKFCEREREERKERKKVSDR